MFVGYPEGTKAYKLYDLEKKYFARSRKIIFQERRFHNFELKENMVLYNKTREKPESSAVGAIITPNERVKEVVNDDDDVEVDIPVLYNHPVEANCEGNFMREVENLNPQRERRPAQRFDDELYNCTEDLTADINKPSNINVSWKE